jgi:hypothetical protein
MIRRSLCLTAVLAAVLTTPASADPLLDAAEFEALTEGRTMTWASYGQVYGVEQYLPGRRVRWTELGDDCKLGHWYMQGPAICFLYEDDPTPACWEITLSGAGMLAVEISDPPGEEPVVVKETTETMPCFGPEVGA